MKAPMIFFLTILGRFSDFFDVIIEKNQVRQSICQGAFLQLTVTYSVDELGDCRHPFLDIAPENVP